MKKYHFLLSLSIVITVLACSERKKADKVLNADATVSSGVTFIDNTDSDTILSSWSKDNVVINHWANDPDNLHPTNGNSANRTFINQYIHLRLVATDLINLSVRPELVKSMPEVSKDELNFTYELRDEAAWDNGEPITVDDVIFTFKANKCPLTDNPHAKPYVENLKTIVKHQDNPRKFTMQMKRKYIQNISFMTDFPIMQSSYYDPKNILAKYSFEQFDDQKFNKDKAKDLNEWATFFNDAKFGRSPEFIKGAGAYQLISWEPGQSITLSRKQNHWTQKLVQPNAYETSYPEKIIFKNNADENSQLLEFKTQALDVSTYLTTKTLLELQKDPEFNKNYYSKFADTYNFSYIAMNMKPDGIEHKKYFVDKKVRRAMALLTPVQDVIDVISLGKATRMATMVSPLKKEEVNDSLKLIPFDIEQAKKLLDEAGWADSDGDNIRDKMVDGEKLKFSFKLSYMTGGAATKDIALMIKEAMYKAGIEANLTPVEFAVFYDNAKKHHFDMMMGAWAGYSTPEDYTQIWHTESWATKGSNYPGFGNAESDALIDSIKYTMNEAKRNEYSKRLQAMIYNEQPYIFMYSGMRKIVIHKRFGNNDMYFESPGVILNNLKLLSSPGVAPKVASIE